MAKRVILTSAGIFDTLEQAAEALGVSTVTVSRRLKVMDGMRWAERIYAIEKEDGSWTVATRPVDNRGYKPLDWRGKKIGAREVKTVKDITGSWYEECW